MTGSAPSATAVPLRFLRWSDASTADAPVWKSIKQLWTSQSPNVALDDEIPAGNYRTQVLQRLASGSLPDVLTIPSSDLALIAVRGGARRLDPLIGTSRYDLSIFYPVALREMLYRGARYGLPHRGSARVLAFNQARFDRAFPTPAVASTQGCACWSTGTKETFNAIKRERKLGLSVAGKIRPSGVLKELVESVGEHKVVATSDFLDPETYK